MSITWRETRRRLREDRERLEQWGQRHSAGGAPSVWLSPSYWCVGLHRLSHFYFVGGHRLLARAFWHLNLLLTGADVSPNSQICGGWVVAYPVGIVIVGKIGRRCTMRGQNTVGGGRGNRDIGGGPGLPILGDDVELEVGSLVLGPVVVGHDVRIGPHCVVLGDVPDHAIVAPNSSTVVVEHSRSCELPVAQ